MNKQEVISKLKSAIPKNNIDDYQRGEAAGLNFALLLLAELDDPEKSVVPQFVADWYDDNQDDFEFNLYRLCVDYDNCELDKEMMIWFRDKNNNPIQTLTAMHQLGYEVKKEKLYEVFLKRTGAQLGVCVPHGEDKTQFTKVELQEYDFDNLDVYEVEEVEE